MEAQIFRQKYHNKMKSHSLTETSEENGVLKAICIKVVFITSIPQCRKLMEILVTSQKVNNILIASNSYPSFESVCRTAKPLITNLGTKRKLHTKKCHAWRNQ